MARNSRGLSLIELLVAMTVAGLVAGAALTVTLSSRRIYDGDRSRTDLNQSLRSGLDLLAVDVRQAGERLPGDFPALEIVDGGAGPDTLILRRNVLDTVLPVCKQLNANTPVDEIEVADSGATPAAGCVPLADADANGWPDNIDEWRDHRVASGGTVSVYVFNPVTGDGEFADFDGDGGNSDKLSVTSASDWVYTYQVVQQCRVYMLEERRFELNGDLLRIVTNGDVAGAANIVHNMVDFEVRAVLSGGTLLDSFGGGDDWSDLESIEITLTGEAATDDRTIQRSLTSRFFPRNVLSL